MRPLVSVSPLIIMLVVTSSFGDDTASPPASAAPDATHLTAGEFKHPVAELRVDLQADRMDLDLKKAEATLSGHVVLSRKDGLQIRAGKVVVRYDAKGQKIRSAVASLGVHVEASGMRGDAPEARLDMDAGKLSLSGPVNLTRGDSTMTAASAVFDLKLETLSVEAMHASVPASSTTVP